MHVIPRYAPVGGIDRCVVVSRRPPLFFGGTRMLVSGR